MGLATSITLIVTVLLVYNMLLQVFSVLFRITGLPKEKAVFQSVSLLTNAGYTTGESELVVSEKLRRRIATASMLSGYFFSVVIASLLINMFLSFNRDELQTQIFTVLLWFGILVAFFLILRIPPVNKALNKGLESLTVKAFRKATQDNFISVLDTYGKDAVVNIFLHRVPDFLEGKCVIDSGLRKDYNVNVLMYKRNGHNHYTQADTIFSVKDTLIAFGPLDSIKEAFLLKDHGEKKTVRRKIKDETANEIIVMSNYGNQVLADIKLNRIPPVLEGKSLVESRIKDYFSINIVMVSRDEKPINLTKDTVIEKSDRIIAFGPYENLHTVFGESGDPDTEAGA